MTEIRHSDKKNKLISRYSYEYDDGNYITKETITQDGETLIHSYTYDTLGQVETMTVSTKDGKELSSLSYTYDLAGNKVSSTEVVNGKEAKTTFSYDDNNRLTNQSGSVTGLTQDGEAVASSTYKLYGSTKKSTDETGNPYAYNGEARDGTGLDYLRARYYDSHAGTFLTEDSYQGELTDPLSQNRYSYVHNNPVNYTDPSGHRLVLTTMGGGGKRSSLASAFTAGIKNFASKLVAPIRTAVQFASVSIRAATATVSYTMVKAHPSHYTDAQKAKVRSEYLAAVGEKVAFHIREAGNLAVNWTKALHQTVRQSCDPKTMKARDKGATLKPVSYGVNLGGVASWDGTSSTSNQPQSNASVVPNLMSEEDLAASRKAGLQLLKILGGEVTGWYNLKRLWTGKDPVTGDKANRWAAAGGLALDLVSYGFVFAKVTKFGKFAKAATAVNAVDDVRGATKAYRGSKSLKAADTIDDVSDTSKGVKAVDAVDDVGDVAVVVRKKTQNITNPLENIEYTDKVRKQMQQGDFHSFPEAVDSFGADGNITQIIGGDGISRTKVEIFGSYKGREGIFEYIIESNNTVNHRFFRPTK